MPTAMPTRRGALFPFAIISISYLLFTVTDGALRMIVLLHAYSKDFSAMQVALMFTLYECAGVVTNLLYERPDTYSDFSERGANILYQFCLPPRVRV